MNTHFRQTAVLFSVGTALVLGASALRADDETKPRHRHHQTTEQKAEIAHPGTTAIPTRDDRSSQETKGHVVGGANGPEYRVRTGSNIPEHYNRKGYSTDSRDNEFLYDKNDIRIQRSNNVADQLRDVPGVTIRGMR